MEGDAAHEALVVLRGELKVTVGTREGREVVLDVFGPGALLGELSVIDGRPRSATVSALSAVEVLSVPSAHFNEFLERHPRVGPRRLDRPLPRGRGQGAPGAQAARLGGEPRTGHHHPRHRAVARSRDPLTPGPTK